MADEQTEWGRRIEEVSEILGKSVSKISVEIGFSSSYLGKFVTGERRELTPQVVARMRDKLGVSAEWLNTGRGRMFETAEQVQERSGMYQAQNRGFSSFAEFRYVELPFWPVPLRAGLVENSDPDSNYGPPEMFAVPVTDPLENYRDQFLLEINGDSMEPRLTAGDKVRCKPVPRENWHFMPPGVYVVSYLNYTLVKRIKSNTLKSGTLVLHSDNDEQAKPIEVPGKEIRGIWAVLEVYGRVR